MKLYYYPKCSTCRKAIKYLAERGVSSTNIDISEKTPSKKELQQMLENYAGDLRKLFNTSGLLYRELKMKEQLPTLTKTEAIKLLQDNGMLIKRPFLIAEDGRGRVGFKEQEWAQVL